MLLGLPHMTSPIVPLLSVSGLFNNDLTSFSIMNRQSDVLPRLNQNRFHIFTAFVSILLLIQRPTLFLSPMCLKQTGKLHEPFADIDNGFNLNKGSVHLK